MRRFIFLVNCLVVLLMICRTPAQSEEDNVCLFSEVPENQGQGGSIPVWQDTTLRVAILFVQFADWPSSPDARGSVGWSYWNPNDPQTYVIPNKFRYPHYWEMYFSRNTYIDPPEPQLPIKHPDAGSHGVRVYGSFRDYWHEVTHGEFDPIPAVTHPEETDSMFCRTMTFHSSTDGCAV